MACEYPRSTCADEHYLVYFTNGECTLQNVCSYEKKWFRCTRSCSVNQCATLNDGPTAAAPETPPDFWR
jgi:hypothetical protein